MNLPSAALAALALILLLFAVAALVERPRPVGHSRHPRWRHPRWRHWAYTLALGVFCSSWTFYGAVGSAARSGWSYAPIYLGPVLLLVFGRGFLSRLGRVAAQERASTVSDFIAARFGHDASVARLVTIIALLGSVPYLALQLRSIGSALSIVSDRNIMLPAMVVSAALLTHFSLLFGTRRFERAARSEGMLYAIGLDSALKLVALIAVAGLSCLMLVRAEAGTVARGLSLLGEKFAPEHLTIEIGAIMLVSCFAVVALPRQFYMGVVEAEGEDDLARARWGLGAYLVAVTLLIIPVALAGLALLPPDVAPDVFVLALPEAAGSQAVLAAALLGGIGAAASMVIVDTTALGTMVSNDLFGGTVIRAGSDGAGVLGRRVLAIRRAAVGGVMVLGLVFAMLVPPALSLASMGIVAFAAMAQFTPHLILATTRGGRDPVAARASLATGLVLWCYTLALPPILPTEWLATLSGTLVDPQRLFGIGNASPFVHGVAWSLGTNLAVHALIAARMMPAPVLPRLFSTQRRVSDVGELAQLAASFVGEERALQSFPAASHGQPVNRRAARRAQELIAGVVGAASARTLVASALASGRMDLADVTRLLDERGQSLRFSRPLLAATFENVDAGISVVDGELNLVAWNARYEEIFSYPPELLRVGAPVEALIRHNAERGDFGDKDRNGNVARRLHHLRRGQPHAFERRRPDGRVIKTVGGPMPGGGYVMSFTDVTEEADMRAELQRTLEELEQRVAERTRALSEANRLLARATQDKTRFLAAASHDLLQPLHAARLFTAALGRGASEGEKALVGRVDSAIVAAEELLRALLDISRLDAGGVTPQPEPVPLAPFLADMAESFRPSAEAKGLRLRIGPLAGQVRTDAGLLRSALQNFLSNAVRYTQSGGVLIGTRRRGGWIRIDVIDTGVGFGGDQAEAIFGEFTRLGTVEVEGMGLGLALVERIMRLIGGKLEVASRPGHGSRFSLLLPAEAETISRPSPQLSRVKNGDGGSLRVLVVDNDPRIVDATIALVERMGHHALGAATIAQAMALADGLDAVLADYRLDHDEDGITLIEALRDKVPALPGAILTAEATPEVRARAGALGLPVHSKPVAPDAIEAFLIAAATSAARSVLQVKP